MQLTEAPSLTGFDETLLRENMVLTLEPSLSLGPGRMMVHEENIVIRDGAPEFLTVRAAPDIPVIAS
jgi:Xaa-Pro aminopeptidase